MKYAFILLLITFGCAKDRQHYHKDYCISIDRNFLQVKDRNSDWGGGMNNDGHGFYVLYLDSLGNIIGFGVDTTFNAQTFTVIPDSVKFHYP